MSIGKISVLGQDIVVKVLDNFIKRYGLTTGGRSVIFKQILKELHRKEIINYDKVWVSSESFSGGNAIRVNTLNSDKKSNEIIQSICNEFEYGTFNPMIDLYEYKMEKLYYNPNKRIEECIFDGGLDVRVKFVTFTKEPPYGTSDYFKIYPPKVKEVS